MRPPATSCSVSEPALPTVLEVVHETAYGYAAPVTQAQHLAYLKPLQDARQQLLAHTLQIEPAPQQRQQDLDAYGNARTLFSLSQPHRALQVRACSRVALQPHAAFEAAASPRWEDVRGRLRYEAGAGYDAAVEFAQPSPYVPRLHALRDYALDCLEPGVPVAEGALALMHRIHADFEFNASATEVDTPLIDAFEQRRGVCQDFAHLMIAALRMAGLAARYVSGYLLTQPPPGQEALVGADASHAWVQVYCPDTPGLPEGWLELDPTNDLVPDTSHVRLALGRDYGDVTPLRGVIRGGGRHTLEVRVSTRRIQEPQARMLLS
ncbi:MAG: transglutaminase family protein [Burkholderiales bacterium]|nr:transglutaminase family protein [Burkholderiales bacterium]